MVYFFDVFQYILNGISIGSLYALVAVGYSMVFGVLKFVNFAHGEIYMIGSYLVMSLVLQGASLWLVFLGAMIATGFLAVATNKFIYRGFQKENKLEILISAVCVSTFLQNIIQIIYSPDALRFPISLPDSILFLPHDLVVRVMGIWRFLIMLMASTCVWLFVVKTKIGKGIRAIASHPNAAEMIGIPVFFLGSVTFFIGGLLATLGGALQGMVVGQVMAYMGVGIGLKAFAAAVLGGIGNIWGAVLGGIFIGLVESILVGFGYSLWKDSVCFILLIIFLLFRPQGILGQKQIIKV